MDFYQKSGGGVTISGGEALLQADFAAAILKKCREAGIHTCVETAASAARNRSKSFSLIPTCFYMT